MRTNQRLNGLVIGPLALKPGCGGGLGRQGGAEAVNILLPGQTRIKRRRRVRPLEDENSREAILTASLLTYPVLRTLSLQFLSVLTGSYVSGTYSIVFVNCPNEQIARDIARAILDKKLAASVNILPKASSLYYWNGEIEEATEVLLLIKTKTSKIHMLSSYIRLVHPFEIPELFSLPMDQGDVHYLKWLEEGMEEE
ncbi:hypothetical protein E5288_WYG006728 [Bos mutus]|uniref:CutA-like protein n=1 Tax=Bos mutus TaxID=72004 RepID=A0A6B0RGG5_9CETA|nr:hypothetical protein [Bos mutus]